MCHSSFWTAGPVKQSSATYSTFFSIETIPAPPIATKGSTKMATYSTEDTSTIKVYVCLGKNIFTTKQNTLYFVDTISFGAITATVRETEVRFGFPVLGVGRLLTDERAAAAAIANYLNQTDTPAKMETEPSHEVERILHLALEIIYLITGESPPSVCGDHVTIKMPPPRSLIPERNTHHKILEVINKITELLTGEFAVRCQDVAVYLSMEEREYVEEHKDFYKDAMMEDQQLPLSLDGSSTGNTPERSPHPPYSRDFTQEEHMIPHHYQDENLLMVKVEVKEEGEETDVRGDDRWMEEEEVSPNVSTDGQKERNNMKKHKTAFPVGGTEDDITADSLEGCPSTPNLYQLVYNSDLSLDPSTDGEHWICSSNKQNLTSHNHTLEKTYSESQLIAQKSISQKKNPYSCPSCGKCFLYKSRLVTHERTHTGEKPYSCSKCEKCFSDQSTLIRHKKLHTREDSYICSDCGKCLPHKSALLKHVRVHREEKSNFCYECERSFSDQSVFLRSEGIHEGTDSCTQCGKCFSQKGAPVTDNVSVKPYSCFECGKCFSYKSELIRHERVHTGEKPFSCTKCGKCFSLKSTLTVHERIHTGEKPYSCSACGKCFSDKSQLINHWKVHTQERPYSCSNCGRCFSQKSALISHERIHTGEKP